MPPDPPDAQAWLAALAARVEDDEAFLASLSDDEVHRLLAEEDVRASGVAAAIRRRVREAEADRARAARGAGLWRWAAGLAGAAVLGVALWAAWPAAGGSAAGEVLLYRNELTRIMGPPTKGAEAPPLARGARDLLAAAEADPPDRALAAEAAAALAEAASGETDPGRLSAAAYFAGLAHRLSGDEDAALGWFRRVPAGTAYEGAAAQALAP